MDVNHNQIQNFFNRITSKFNFILKKGIRLFLIRFPDIFYFLLKYYTRPKKSGTGKNQIINGLIENGIHFQTNRFSIQEIEELKKITFFYFEKWKEKMAHLSCPENQSEIHFEDKENNVYFSKGKRFEVDRRIRVYWRYNQADIPLPIRKLMFDASFRDLIADYYNIKNIENIDCPMIVAEKLLPSTSWEKWHIDRISDQFKIMIPLHDIGENMGPMYYLMKSQTPKKARKSIYHSIFTNGVGANINLEKVIAKESGKIVSTICKTGDCIYFDTFGIHSGSQCLEGERNILMLYFSINSKKNKRLSYLRDKINY